MLNMFLEAVGDIDVATLTPNHIRRYLNAIRITQPKEVHKHIAILRVFSNWLKAQNQIRLLACRQDPPHRPSRWWLMTSRRLAVRKKLPLAL